MRWGTAHGASELEVAISADDPAKLADFDLAGFRTVAVADPFELEGRRLHTAHPVTLGMAIATRESAFRERARE